MKSKSCLSEQELILHYYGELAANDAQTRHLADCLHCQLRRAALEHDLAKLPDLAYAPDFAAGTRMAARVSEQLHKRRNSWKPAMAASAVAAFALVVTISLWSPQGQPVQMVQSSAPPHESLSLNEDMPDIDFLEDLELLKELELLSQIEGV